MSRRVWIRKMSFNLSRRIGWRLAASLAVVLLLVAGMWEFRAAANMQSAPASAQGRKRIAAQKKFNEAQALQKEQTADSLPLAAQKYQEALLLWREIGAKREEATTLHNLGEVYDSLGKYQKALDFYNQALRLRRAARDRSGQGETLNNIGYVYESLEEREKALDFYLKALPLVRAARDRHREAITLLNIGVAYYFLREDQKALNFYNQSLRLSRAARDGRLEAKTLHNIGHVYKSLGEKEKALDSFSQALPFLRAADKPKEEAEILKDIGSLYESMGEKQKAQDFYAQADAPLSPGRRQPAPEKVQDALAVFSKLQEAETLHKQGTAESLPLAAQKYQETLQLIRALGGDNREGEATTLNRIGAVYDSLRENRKALDFYNQALSLMRETGDREGEARMLNNIGSVYDSLGENEKALDFCNQALKLQRALGNRNGEASALNNIGIAYDWLGERPKALDFYNQALPLMRETGDRRGEGRTLGNIGAVYHSVGEMQKALDFYNRALSLMRETGDRRGEAKSLNNIGAVYASLGENEKALDFCDQALGPTRETGDRSAEAATLTNIGNIYSLLGEKRKALDLYNQALGLQRALGNRREEAKALTNIGSVYYSLGEKRKALDFCNQALPLMRETGDRSAEAGTLNNIGNSYDWLGEKRKALDLYNQALELQRAIGDREREAGTLCNIAETKRALGRFDESRSYVESALEITESIRTNVVSKELRASFFATVQDKYGFYIDLLMRMHSREPNKGHDAEAIEASERARARALIESLTEARADIQRGVAPELLARERSLQQRLNAKANQESTLSASGADDARLALLRREIDALTVELQQVETQIRQASPSYAALTQPQPLSLAEIQRQTLDDDTLLLEYSLGEDRSFLWAVTTTTINSYILPKRDEIEAAAKRVYELMSKSPGKRSQTAKPGDSSVNEEGGEYLTAAAGLCRTLLGPVAGQLGKKRLLIVADGMLHYVSFGALPDPNSLKASAGGWQPLVVEHEIVNMPSATTLAVLRRELAGRKPAARTVAVLADPVFSADDERINSGTRLAARQTTQPASNPLNEIISRKLVQIAGAAPGVAPGKARIPRLPYTRQEAERIMALAPALGLEALDFKASRAMVMSGQLSQYRYIHFATHGLADSERPELSTIVLSLYDKQGRPQEGFLRAHEVYNLDLPAELVTLSACETGLGKLTRGEGLVSLTRGFMYAGAARVVVSLWSVSDQATAELMEKFYQRMLVGGERPAAALRAAQVEMWLEKKWEAPYYWAAFTLQGEWR